MKKFIAIFLMCLVPVLQARVVRLVNHEFMGTKQWLPGTIVAFAGEEIELHLINKAPSGIHGFQIRSLDLKVNVKKGTTEIRKLKVSKAGIYDINCHMHKAHIGGQLVVLNK